jgi:glycosyltransferase involved in cell wall biosynthesis
LVSLCIPTYNGAQFLRECLESALQQDYPNLEILLVDDGSTDETLTIATQVLTGRAKVAIVANDVNLGLVGNWNRCLELAKGDFVKFLFQDDLLAPTCVSKMVAAGRSGQLVACHRDIAIESTVSHGVKGFFEEHTARMRKLWPERRELSPHEFAATALSHGIDYNLYGEPTALLFHRSHWETQGMYDPEFKHLCDLEMTYRVAMKFGYVHLGEELCTFRIHGSSATTDNIERKTAQTAVDHIKLVDKIGNDPKFLPFLSSKRNQIEFSRNALRIQRWFASLGAEASSVSAAQRKRIQLLGRVPAMGRLFDLSIKLRSRVQKMRERPS